jgi:hypothetical protein
MRESRSERYAAGGHHPTHSRLVRGNGVQLCAEQVDPEVPIHGDPQEPLADADEGGRLRDRVGGKVVEFYPVVVAQPPHKAARRCGEATLVKLDEANDVAKRRVRLPVRRRRNDPRWGAPSTFAASCPPFTSSCRVNSVVVDRVHSRGPALRLAGVDPLQARGEAGEAAARKDEMSRGREQGGAQPGSRGEKRGAADAK